MRRYFSKKEELFLLTLGAFVSVSFAFVFYGGHKTIKNDLKPVATISKTVFEIDSSKDFFKSHRSCLLIQALASF